MGQLNIRIVRLEPMRVASAHGYGEAPEDQAWKKLLAWAEPEGLLEDPSAVRFFGFNNPGPHPGSPNYGYEQWVTVGPEVQCSGEVQLKDFPGGLYAVTRCKGIPQIGPTWKKLVTWFENSSHKRAYHQWLEECLSPPTDPELPLEQYVFDLYMPIAE